MFSLPVALIQSSIPQITVEIQRLYQADDCPWIIGYSGGKDSTAILQLTWNAVAALPPEKRHKPIYVLTTDTLVENPIVAAWVRQSHERIRQAAAKESLPFQPHLLFPEVKDTFWVNLIGKGYPAPRHMFRWCTERLKIQPADRFVKTVIRTTGEVIIVLGTRKAESSRRAEVMKEHEMGNVGDRLQPSETEPQSSDPKSNDSSASQTLRNSLLYRGNLPNSLVYSPIADWHDDEVWLYLMQYPNPWEHSNKELFTLYRGATADNECPFVIDTSTPSCGDSRFGCWVCTLVNKDKSMMAMIQNDDQKAWMQPLLDLRDELDEHDDYHRRDFRRMSGKVQLFERNIGSGKTEIVPIPGPYTKFWREKWLETLLQAQETVRAHAPNGMSDITLINNAELSEIRCIWREDKHEFDDALPRIYRQVTGKIFHDSRPGAETNLLGSDEWSVLEDVCCDETGEVDAMHLELMAKLLDTERQYATMNRRVGIYDALEKCFTTSSRSEQEALEHAHFVRDMKTAAKQGDVNQIKNQAKQLSLIDSTALRATTSEAATPRPLSNENEHPDDSGDSRNQKISPNGWAALKFKASQGQDAES